MMTLEKCNFIKAEIEETLSRLSTKYGCKIDIQSVRGDHNGFTMSVVGKELVIENGEVIRLTTQALDACTKYNLNPNKKSHDGYRIVDYKSRNRKNPWILEKFGKPYKTTNSFVIGRFSNHIVEPPKSSVGKYEGAF